MSVSLINHANLNVVGYLLDAHHDLVKKNKVNELALHFFNLIGLCCYEIEVPKKFEAKKDFIERVMLEFSRLKNEYVEKYLKDKFDYLSEWLKEDRTNYSLLMRLLNSSKYTIKKSGDILYVSWEGSNGAKKEQKYSIQPFIQFLFSKGAFCIQENQIEETQYVSWVQVMVEWSLETHVEHYKRIKKLFDLLPMPLPERSVHRMSSQSFQDFLIDKSYKCLLKTLELKALPPCLCLLLCQFFKVNEYARKLMLLSATTNYRESLGWQNIVTSSSETQYLERYLQLYDLLDKDEELAIALYDHLLTEAEFVALKNVLYKVPHHSPKNDNSIPYLESLNEDLAFMQNREFFANIRSNVSSYEDFLEINNILEEDKAVRQVFFSLFDASKWNLLEIILRSKSIDALKVLVKDSRKIQTLCSNIYLNSILIPLFKAPERSDIYEILYYILHHFQIIKDVVLSERMFKSEMKESVRILLKSVDRVNKTQFLERCRLLDERLFASYGNQLKTFPIHFWMNLLIDSDKLDFNLAIQRLTDALDEQSILRNHLKKAVNGRIQNEQENIEALEERKLYFFQLFLEHIQGHFSPSHVNTLMFIYDFMKNMDKTLIIDWKILNEMDANRQSNALSSPQLKPLPRLSIGKGRIIHAEQEGKNILSPIAARKSSDKFREEDNNSFNFGNSNSLSLPKSPLSATRFNPSKLKPLDISSNISSGNSSTRESPTSQNQHRSVTIDLSAGSSPVVGYSKYATYFHPFSPASGDDKHFLLSPQLGSISEGINQPKSTSNALAQIDIITFMKDSHNNEINSYLELIHRVWQQFDLSALQITHILFDYLPLLTKTLLRRGRDLLEQEMNALNSFKEILNHAIPPDVAYSWFLHAPQIKKTMGILEEINEDLALIEEMDPLQEPAQLSSLSASKYRTGLSVGSYRLRIELKISLLADLNRSEKPSNLHFRHLDFSFQMKELCAEIFSARIPFSLKFITDRFYPEILRSGSFSLFHSANPKGLAFFSELMKPQVETESPLLKISVINLTNLEACSSSFVLPYSYKKLKQEPALFSILGETMEQYCDARRKESIRELHEYSQQYEKSMALKNQVEELYMSYSHTLLNSPKEVKANDPKLTIFFETIRKQYEFSLHWLSSNQPLKQKIKVDLVNGLHSYKHFFFSNENAIYSNQSIAFLYAMPPSTNRIVKTFITHLLRAKNVIKNRFYFDQGKEILAGDKKSHPPQSKYVVDHINFEFNPHLSNTVSVSMGEAVQAVPYGDLIHKNNFSHLLCWQILMVLSSLMDKIKRTPTATEAGIIFHDQKHLPSIKGKK